MPKAQRERRERTDNYHLILQWCGSPEQRLYEGIRPITLFGIPPAERAEETGVTESTLRRAAAAFDTHGMISLFRPTKAQRDDHHRSLPVPMHQLIVDLKAEYKEGVQGLADKSHANTSKTGVDLPTRNLIRKKQEENPLLSAYS